MTYRKQTTQDEVELETMAEAELIRLKRQFRIMENDRMNYAEDARLQLSTQQNMIKRLEAEKAELLLAIKTANSQGNLRKDEQLNEKLRNLLEKRQDYIETINLKKQEIAELNGQIRKLGKDVTALKMKVRTDTQSKELAARQNKTVYILENKLEVVTKRFNLVVAENTKIRNEIEVLLKERSQFNGSWKKLNGQLDTGKQIINDLIEQATITFNQRDEELNKIYTLRERGMKDLNTHVSEMSELQRTLDNEMKLQEFLGIKGQYREMIDLNAKRDAERLAKIEEKKNKIATYAEILQQIKEFTGEQEIDKLTALFIKQEEENFALFNYVNELNDELESLQSRMTQLTTAIEEARTQSTHRGQQQIETLKEITLQLEKQIQLSDKAENELTQCNNTIQSLLQGVESLFTTIQCDSSPILNLLGDDHKISMSNVMLYLSHIEKKITNMLHKVYWFDKSNKVPPRIDESRKPILKTPALPLIAPVQPCPLCVEVEEMQSVSEGLEKPFTRDEATEKLENRSEEDSKTLLHNVSDCHLPAARRIIQKRYQ